MKFNYSFPYRFLNLSDEEKKCVETNFSGNDIIMSVAVDMNNVKIDVEKIDIVLEAENTHTFYRKLFIITQGISEFRISRDILGSRVKYALILVARQDGEIEIDYNGVKSSDYYEGGDCIGLLEKGIMIIENETGENKTGLTGLVKISPTEKDLIAYDLTNDWITIEMPKATYEKFYSWQQDNKTAPFAVASLGNNCIQFAIIQALKETQHHDREWWETLQNLLQYEGYEIDDMDISDIPGATNKILGNCIQSMIDAAVPDIDIQDTSIVA